MIQINPLKSYIDGGVRAALTTPPSASLVFDLPGKAIWVKGVKLKGTDHTYIFNHDNYITLTNTPDKNNPESEDIKIGVNITTLKNVIDTTYNGGTLALLQEGLNTEERTWQAKILHNYINNVLPTTKNLKINGTNYAIYTTADSLPQFFVPTSLGTTGQILACTSSGLIWVDQIQNTDYRVSQSSTTSNSDYRIILKQGANNNPETDFVRFSEYLTFNPYTKTLKINNIKVVTATDIYAGSNAGLVPAATSAQQNYYLRGDGTWVNIATEMAAANTWRPIKVGNTDALGSGTNTGTLSFIAGTGITLSWDATNKRIIITNSSPDINHNTDETVRQVPKTDNVNRPIMMINGSTSAGEQINTSMFSTGIYANASTKMIIANGFIKAGSSNSYVLLGDGGHKAVSDFATSGHNHDGRYLRWNGSAADISAMGWGTLTAANGYTILSHAASSDGGDVGFTSKGGQIFMQLDGYYYQREGRHRVLDTSDFTVFSNIGSQTTRITIGEITKDLKIDADVLDGQHLMTQVSNWNTDSLSIFKSSENSTSNAPTTDYTYGVTLRFHRDISTYYTNLVTSLYYDRLFFRRKTEGGYQTWRELIHSGNIGSQSVNYANSAGNADSADRANYLSGHGVSPNNSHPGHGAKVFYSWNIGQAGNDTSGYSNGITIGSHPGDTGYGFQIVQNLWDDRTYTRRYNGGWQSWKTLAWTSDIPTVTNYYWANVKVSASSSTITYPTFGSLSVINDSCNNGTNALAYFRHYSNNDWGLIVDKSQSYTYGVDIRAGGDYALKVGNGNTRLIGATIIGADTTPSYTLDVRGNIRATESLIVSTNNTTGGGIIFADDGDIVDLNDAYCTMRFTSGIRITNANKGGNIVHELNADGRLYNYGFVHRSYNSQNYLLTSNGDARHINSLPYASWKEQWIDMTGYSESYWHPVVTNLPYSGYRRIKVTVQLNSGTKPSWSTHSSGFTCNLDLWVTAHGWGTTSSETICLNSTYAFTDQNPVGWSQLGNSSLGILLLRGGGRYLVYTDWDTSWTIHNQSITDYAGTQYQQTCGPYTSWPGIFNGSTNKNWIYANTRGNIITDDWLSIRDYAGSYHGRSNSISGYAGEIWFGGNFHINSQNGQNLYLNYHTSAFISLAQGGGRVGIGTDSPSYKLHISGDCGATNFYSTSDIRYKKVLSNIKINIYELAQIPLFNFKWIDNRDNLLHSGTSAQSVEKILPNVVSSKNPDQLHLDYAILGTIAGITACKELVTQKSELQELKEKVKQLEDKLHKYENTL